MVYQNITRSPGMNEGITVRRMISNADRKNGSPRIFDHLQIQPGGGTKYHIHHNEYEIYYICKGTAEYNDNGNTVILHAGDSTYTSDGEGHSIRNVGTDVLEVVALICTLQDFE